MLNLESGWQILLESYMHGMWTRYHWQSSFSCYQEQGSQCHPTSPGCNCSYVITSLQLLLANCSLPFIKCCLKATKASFCHFGKGWLFRGNKQPASLNFPKVTDAGRNMSLDGPPCPPFPKPVLDAAHLISIN